MRWTNHPRIFLEVAIVKLCQMEVKAHRASRHPAQIDTIANKIEQLENELQEFKSNGVQQSHKRPQHKRRSLRTRSSRKGFQPQLEKSMKF